MEKDTVGYRAFNLKTIVGGKKMLKKILLITIALLSSATITTLAEPQQTPQTQPEKPKVAAQGAILIDAETGRVLWGKNEYSPLAMASTTNVMHT